MSSPVLILERVTRVTPLGLRFWDRVTGQAIGTELAVSAFPKDDAARRVRAFVTAGMVHAFRDLPGLRDVEIGDVDLNTLSSRSFVIEVANPTGRFQEFSLLATGWSRGLLPWLDAADTLPLTATRSIPLFSAPGRAIPSGMVAVRAELWDPLASSATPPGPLPGAPAAGAVLEVTAPGADGVLGIADDRGRVVVPLPYPEPPTPVGAMGSPMAGGAGALTEQSWPLRLRARYTPVRADTPLPELHATLGQGPATLWSNWGLRRPVTETDAVLRYGQDLILRTIDSAVMAQPLPVLYITPAGSPL